MAPLCARRLASPLWIFRTLPGIYTQSHPSPPRTAFLHPCAFICWGASHFKGIVCVYTRNASPTNDTMQRTTPICLRAHPKKYFCHIVTSRAYSFVNTHKHTHPKLNQILFGCTLMTALRCVVSTKIRATQLSPYTSRVVTAFAA